jgi:hypothetical protein
VTRLEDGIRWQMPSERIQIVVSFQGANIFLLGQKIQSKTYQYVPNKPA